MKSIIEKFEQQLNMAIESATENLFEKFRDEVLRNLEKPTVYLAFENDHLYITVCFFNESGNVARVFNLSPEGFDVSDWNNGVDAKAMIYGLDGNHLNDSDRGKFASYLRDLADVIEPQRDNNEQI